MPGSWRQGHVVSAEHALAMGCLSAEQLGTHVAIVASHSCDIASPDECAVELLIARVISQPAGHCCNGNSVRTLHLPLVEAEASSAQTWIEAAIAQRCTIEKAMLLAAEPHPNRRLSAQQCSVLQRWLAQRYFRVAFPDAFNQWLRESKMEEELTKVAKRHTGSLRAIYVDLGGDNGEHERPDDPYSIELYLVYDSSQVSNADDSQRSAAELTAAFEKRCRKDGTWRWFELLACKATSDAVFSLRAANEFHRWRLEHRSVDGEPMDSTT